MTKKLLLADDSITIQKVIGIIFETEDYQLLVTDNGDDALKKAREELPDLVIADISMPGKDGFELCQAIKSDPRLSHASVMLLPGTFDHFDEDRAQAVGADGWLTKPFESQALLNKVAQLLEVEPVRLAADAPVAAPTDFAAELESPVDAGGAAAAVAAPALDDAVLGLGAVGVTSMADEAAEGAADDIWDAVSFEDDDLSTEEAPAFTDVSFADAAGVETVVAAEESPFEWSDTEPAADESVFELADEAPLELSDELADEPPVAEEMVFAATANGSPGIDSDEGNLAADVEAFALAEEAGDKPLELEDEVLPVASLGAADFGFEELEPLNLAAETTDVDDIEFEEPMLSSAPVSADQPEAVNRESFVADSLAGEDQELPVVELLNEEALGEDEEVLDLADEDILDEEPLSAVADEEPEPIELDVEEVADADGAGVVFADDVPLVDDVATSLVAEGSDQPMAGFAAAPVVEELLEEEPVAEELLEEEPVAEEPVEEEPVAEEPVAEEPVAEELLAEELLEEELLEEELLEGEPVAEEPVAGFASDGLDEVVAAPEVEDDDGFYFDASETDGVAVAAGAAASVAAANIDAGGGVEKVEQQLRQLSDDDLRVVVARVAGPIIERLAAEMVERIAWEVVPDLAESMIREEIRKIKSAGE